MDTSSSNQRQNGPKEVTVADFIAHIRDETSGDRGDPEPLSGEWQYSVDSDGQIEIMFFNGIYTFSPEEFEDIKRQMPKAVWKEYPHDWAPDEIDEVVDYLTSHDLVELLKEDPSGALQQVKIHLSADTEDGGEDFPAWVRHLDGPDIDVLSRGVLKVLGIPVAEQAPKMEAESPQALVDKLLGESQ